jgi:hypothetical protein
VARRSCCFGKGGIVKEVDKILEYARAGTPQALVRMNDGECGIMFNHNFVAARGDQKGTIELQTHLIDAINHRQERYWIGYPCPVCMQKQYHQVVSAGYFDPDYEYNTYAVVNTNRNWKRFHKELIAALDRKQIVWVSGEDQDLTKLEAVSEFSPDIIAHIKCKPKDTWSEYHDILQKCLSIQAPRRVFLFSCGPTARVLVRSMFQMRPDSTYLDVGSTFDPYTRDVWHKCHKGTLKACEGCN